jgi:hypothetical protein
MRGNALDLRVFHNLEINEQTIFASPATNGAANLTRHSAKAVDPVQYASQVILLRERLT